MVSSPSAPKPLYSFDSLANWPDRLNRWQKSFAVANPKDCNDFDHLKGKLVRIDGVDWKVVNIDAPMHASPWKKGERISLGVDYG